MSELIILDVAHGNSALLLSRNEAAVFDVAQKDTLLQTIKKLGITTIEYLYLSHLDKDHVGALANLLYSLSVKVKQIFINPDPSKRGPRNVVLRRAVDDTAKRNGTTVHAATIASPIAQIGDVTVKTLSPLASDYLVGAGGDDINGNEIDSNSSSVVLQLFHNNQSIALFAADMDQRSLDMMMQSGNSLVSDVLVFPHHGGNCAEDDAANAVFAGQLAAQVQPKLTVFSMSRTMFRNPRPEIIAAVRAAAPYTYISCTQLSTNCLQNLPQNRTNWDSYLLDLPGEGRETMVSCGGTLHLHLQGSATQYPTTTGLHTQFIQLNVPDALCR